MMNRSALEAWWDRQVASKRQELAPFKGLPTDGASWVIMSLFFGTVGLMDNRIRVNYVNPFPIVEKLFELWKADKK